MTQDEILTRARAACIKAGGGGAYGRGATWAAAVRAGLHDDYVEVKIAIAAITDANRPLSEIAPPDPDLIAAREWAAGAWYGSPKKYFSGEVDHHPIIVGFLAGCRHARGEGV